MGKSGHVPPRYQAGYLDALDGRTAVAVAMRARWQEYTDDLGGADGLSYAQRSLVERVLWLEHWLRVQERALAEGNADKFDAGKWTQACNSLLGILTRLGLDRRQKDVTRLADYLGRRVQADG